MSWNLLSWTKQWNSVQTRLVSCTLVALSTEPLPGATASCHLIVHTLFLFCLLALEYCMQPYKPYSSWKNIRLAKCFPNKAVSSPSLVAPPPLAGPYSGAAEQHDALKSSMLTTHFCNKDVFSFSFYFTCCTATPAGPHTGAAEQHGVLEEQQAHDV